MSVKDLIAKYNASEVGGRLLVRVAGRNEFMATFDQNGFQLTEIGRKLEAGELRSEGQVDEAPRPKRKKREEAKQDDGADTAAADIMSDLESGLDD